MLVIEAPASRFMEAARRKTVGASLASNAVFISKTRSYQLKDWPVCRTCFKHQSCRAGLGSLVFSSFMWRAHRLRDPPHGNATRSCEFWTELFDHLPHQPCLQSWPALKGDSIDDLLKELGALLSRFRAKGGMQACQGSTNQTAIPNLQRFKTQHLLISQVCFISFVVSNPHLWDTSNPVGEYAQDHPAHGPRVVRHATWP